MAEHGAAAVIPGDHVELNQEVRTLLQRRLLRESGLVLFAHPLLIAVVVWYTWNEMPHADAMGWALAVSLATVFRAAWLHTVPHRALSDRDIWLGVRVTVVLVGTTWGVGAAIAFQDL